MTFHPPDPSRQSPRSVVLPPLGPNQSVGQLVVCCCWYAAAAAAAGEFDSEFVSVRSVKSRQLSLSISCRLYGGKRRQAEDSREREGERETCAMRER